jgi:hypothetical protein
MSVRQRTKHSRGHIEDVSLLVAWALQYCPFRMTPGRILLARFASSAISQAEQLEKALGVCMVHEMRHVHERCYLLGRVADFGYAVTRVKEAITQEPVVLDRLANRNLAIIAARAVRRVLLRPENTFDLRDLITHSTKEVQRMLGARSPFTEDR